MDKKFLEIAVAIIFKDKKVLFGFRKDYKLWEFPGGKVETHQNETPEEAIQREVFEEVGIQIQVPPVHGVCFAELENKKRYILHLFQITQWEGSLQNKAHEQLKWVNLHEIHTLKTHKLNKTLMPYIFSL